MSLDCSVKSFTEIALKITLKITTGFFPKAVQAVRLRDERRFNVARRGLLVNGHKQWNVPAPRLPFCTTVRFADTKSSRYDNMSNHSSFPISNIPPSLIFLMLYLARDNRTPPGFILCLQFHETTTQRRSVFRILLQYNSRLLRRIFRPRR